MTITVKIERPGDVVPIKMEFRREHPDPELDPFTRLVSRTGLTDREARLAEDLGDEINVFLNEIAAGRGEDLDRFICTDDDGRAFVAGRRALSLGAPIGALRGVV